MTDALTIAKLLLAGSPQAVNCDGFLLPQTQYDHAPRPTPNYIASDNADYMCRDFLGVPSSSDLLACNGWKDRKWYIILDKNRTPEQLVCDIRHEWGHQNEIDAGVSREDDAWHNGWSRK
jgi:hypothetical protein